MSSTIKNYLERKKRDLSNKSNNDNLNFSLSKDDTGVFSARFDPPTCSVMLNNCLKELNVKHGVVLLLNLPPLGFIPHLGLPPFNCSSIHKPPRNASP